MRRITEALPGATELFLAPVCGLGELFFGLSVFRNAGVRALQMRRRIHWLHKVLEQGKDTLGTDRDKTK